ncbi:glycosyltransferase [Streptomyces albidoflavus]|uniref:Pau25 n=1 Tax=Streptomyces paulus TaxID=285551 RepID=A0A075F257_9ACTN|nr:MULTISPECIES: glycosyltransferase [Streptomyces]AIE54192.1 Pau25 [Streptomyces paulus]BDH49599.1 dNTP-hexose glycosyl transferase [Streptomyces albus]AGI86993.1 C-glycosyltransferase SaqGT5 [Streptomyces albidoflavus]EFE84893.1 C-glycosyltransferase SaqGT5 [Streptomyces albidoflavus]QLP90764.1 C-glycosyltransferase SaqGT5 [Streptomyces albidoflavus]
MRFLFVTGGSPATAYAITPLATAARNAGHEVLVASNQETMAAIAGAGLPGVCVSSVPIRHHITHDRQGVPLVRSDDPEEQVRSIGDAFGRMAAAYQEPLFALARDWRPDVVVGGTLTFSAPVLAARLGVPHVRHAWDSGEPVAVDVAAEREMRPELEALGLDGIPASQLLIDVCPPSVRPSEGAWDAVSMRWIPCNLQPPLEPWMYTKSGRRRVAVTAGTKTAPGYFFDYLVELVAKLKGLDAEILVSAPEAVAAELGEATGMHVGWLPFDVVARTCDLLVHHAGGGTALTGMAYGVPQLLIPNMPKLVPPSERLADYGAARMILPGDDTPAAVTSAAQDLLTTASYGERARSLAEEVAGMPSPAEVVHLVENIR